MADTLSDRLRAIHEDNPNMLGGADIRDAAAELDRREARLTALEQALQQIVGESDSACGCDHTDEHCCVLNGGGCAFCTAAVALALAAALKG